MSKMSSEEEEAVQAEFALLEKEARGEVSQYATSRAKSPLIKLLMPQTVDDVAERQKIEQRLPAVPSTLPQVDMDEAYENDRVKQKDRQREQDLLTIAMPS